MIIVGELINSTRKEVAEMLERRDAGYVRNLARKQAEAGARFVDVNAGIFLDREVELIEWLVTTIQEVLDVSICLDSPNPLAIEAGLRVHRGKAMVNSITGEESRFGEIAPLISKYDASVVALCMNDNGIPEKSEERLAAADDLIQRLKQIGVRQEKIFLDPLVQPISVNSSYGLETLKTIRIIKQKYPEAHTICGLSNVSFGLPNRQLLNRAFLVMAIANGLDGAILNPLNEELAALLQASETLSGQDEYCLEYLKKFG